MTSFLLKVYLKGSVQSKVTNVQKRWIIKTELVVTHHRSLLETVCCKIQPVLTSALESQESALFLLPSENSVEKLGLKSAQAKILV